MRATEQRTAVRPCREGVTASAHRVASNLATCFRSLRVADRRLRFLLQTGCQTQNPDRNMRKWLIVRERDPWQSRNASIRIAPIWDRRARAVCTTEQLDEDELMDRRDMMQRAAAALCAAGVPFGALVESAFAATPATGAAASRQARALRLRQAQGARHASSAPLPTSRVRMRCRRPSRRLNWDRWQSIRFRNEQSLWADDHLRFQVRFFHLGFTIQEAGAHVHHRERPGPGAGLRPQHVRLQRQRPQARRGARESWLRGLSA